MSTKNVPAVTWASDATCRWAAWPIQTWSGCAAIGKAGFTNAQPSRVPSGAPRV